MRGGAAGTYVELLGGKGPGADAGGVGLDDAVDVLDVEGRDGQAGDDAADARVGAGDEGVGAVVDVEHERVGALDQHALAGLECGGDERHGIDHVGAQLLVVRLATRSACVGGTNRGGRTL